jgi:hypothetical protein
MEGCGGVLRDRDGRVENGCEARLGTMEHCGGATGGAPRASRAPAELPASRRSRHEPGAYLRARAGEALPRFELTRRGKDECPEQGSAVDTKLFPRAVVALGAGFATVGDTCDSRLGVELFPAAGGKGSLHVVADVEWTLTDAEQAHIATRGAELWVVKGPAIHHFDGKAWSNVAAPSKDSALTSAVADGAGALWLIDRGALVERKGDAFISYAPPPEGASAVVVGPGGGLVVLAGHRLYRVRR